MQPRPWAGMQIHTTGRRPFAQITLTKIKSPDTIESVRMWGSCYSQARWWEGEWPRGPAGPAAARLSCERVGTRRPHAPSSASVGKMPQSTHTGLDAQWAGPLGGAPSVGDVNK